MALLSLLDVTLHFGGPAILDNVNLQIDPGERVCLVGRNGAGKSTLMRVIAGETQPDSGEVFRQPDAIYARLTQEVPREVAEATVRDLIASGLRLAGPHDEDWERDLHVDQLLERLGLDPDAAFAELSGGLKRRALLGRALAARPDLLLLDEPTNHLDIESILWLEQFLVSARLTLLFVTHDRAFLRSLSTRIIELDRGRLSSWNCDYATYLARKADVREAEEKQQALFDKKLAQEEVWIRRGVKAQRSRAQHRVHELERLRAERRARREQTGNVTLRLAEAERSGLKVIDAEGVSFAWPGGPAVVRDFSTVITRADKIGLVGPNGAGKTTLIKLLLGQLAPTSGLIRQGTQLEVLYFDQHRAEIDDDKSVADNIAGGNATVTIDGRTRHVISYLQDFLFTPDRARTPARVLSGGERNRLLLARLFTRPANVLVMDEPTNDLDAETLELLEELLVDYQGTLLLVSHDRDFLDEVVTSTFVFEGDGRIAEYVGGYSDWQRDVARRLAAPPAAVKVSLPVPAPPAKKPARGRKLNVKEQRELAELPARIEALEKEQAALAAQLANPQLYRTDAAGVTAARRKAAALESEHAAAMARWEALESQG